MRYSIIDDLRALAIINMVIYHTLFDLVYIFGVNIRWFNSSIGFIWEQYICWSFILIAGFCQSFAKKSLKEGLIVSFWGLIISLFTYLVPLGMNINFGVLTFIGLAILVTIPLKKIYNKINPVLGISIAIFLFIIFRNINYGYLGFGDFNLFKLPSSLYSVEPNWILTLIGFPFQGFSSADYFSFFPWYFLFLTGYFLYFVLKKYKKLVYLKSKPFPVLTFISEHSLLIYILHQPIIFGILYLLF